MTEKLDFHQFCAHWALKLLTNERKTKRMSSTIDFLSQYHFDGEEFFDRIFTGDET